MGVKERVEVKLKSNEFEFSREQERLELDSVISNDGKGQTYNTGIHKIDLGSLKKVKWVYVSTDKAILVELDGSALRLAKEGHFIGWVEFSTMDIVVPQDITKVFVAVAGE